MVLILGVHVLIDVVSAGSRYSLRAAACVTALHFTVRQRVRSDQSVG